MTLPKELLNAIDRRHAIPTPPQVVSRLLRLASNPNYRNEQLVRLLSSDAGVSCDLLRVANSSLFAGMRKITSIQEAAVRMGISQVRSLVVSRCMLAAVRRLGDMSIDLGYFWRRSLATAVLTSHFSDQLKCAPKDEAFTCGLLCDIGVVVLAAALPDVSQPILAEYPRRKACDLRPREMELFGATHADIGALALEHWGLPASFVDTVRNHHGTGEEAVGGGGLPNILDGAGEMARILCDPPGGAEARASCRWVLERTGMPLAVVESILPQVAVDIGELAVALQLEVLGGRAFALLSECLSGELATAGG